MITDYTLMASLNNIERWGTLPRLRRTTVASHTFDVCWTVEWIVAEHLTGVTPEEHLQVLQYAMRHDKIEGLTGDMPSPPKRLGFIKDDETNFRARYPAVTSDPVPRTKSLVKLADRLCMLRDAMAETEMGNRAFEPVLAKCAKLVDAALDGAREWWPSLDGVLCRDMIKAYTREAPPLVGISIIVEEDMLSHE